MGTSVCVCLSVCKDISRITRAIFIKFLAAARSSTSFIAIRYVLPVVEDIMFFFYNGPYSGKNFAMNDRFRLDLFLYRKVVQNSIFYY